MADTAPGHAGPDARQPAHAPRDPGRIVIIGAGPTGLGAGYRLKELGHANFEIFERHPYVGGLAHSFTDDAGFTWDIGGHVMFSHYTYYDRCFERLMGEEFTLNNRESWVRMMDRWVPYPFQNNVRYLPPQACYECLSGLIKAQHGKGRVPSPAAAANFGEFIDAVFGEGIAKYFMRPYNFKVWAYPPERMNKQWIGERVAVLDVDRALRNAILGTDDFGWGPNNQFKFPLRGGTGEFYRRFGPELGLSPDGRETPASHIRLNREVASIDHERREVTFRDGTRTTYDALLTTMPLDVLVGSVLRGAIPDRVRAAAAGLLHSSGYMVGIGLKSRTPGGGTPSTMSWMYFPEDNCPFYRVTYLSNYSPFMTPDKANYYSLLCEVSESEVKPTPGNAGKNPDAVIEDVIGGLERAGLLEPGERANIVSRWCYYADYSYPTPSVERDAILSEVIPWLESRGIYSRGRFGMWKYEVANTDHSLMQGVELADRLLLGQPETTIGMVYRVTDDGRNAASHERPAHAGSGEKRLAHVEVKPAPAGDVDAGDVGEDEVGMTGGARK
ncbi:MAG: FAD-dependent oxidoreductase [Planctomycetota bacterium]|nr:FAD-dependent oxidoreductase [Planctomycetota bacterium]